MPRAIPHMGVSRTLVDEASAASLLLGTALGGGFLALPHATSPAGCLPSAGLLAVCWATLLLESNLVADLVIDYHEATNASRTVSFDTLGREAFGPIGGNLISATFLCLMVTTLVAQIAKGSSLITCAWVPAGVRCAILAGLISTFARSASPQLLGATNGFLTIGFVAAAAALFRGSLDVVSWGRLARADWSVCLQAAPTILQLHVYCEVVPTICQLLKYSRRRVRRAMGIGSVALLTMQVVWSTLGIAVSPYSSGALRTDPVDVLLSTGGALGAATTTTAVCAIATTILGTARAIDTWSKDALRDRATPRRPLWAFAALIGLPTLIAARTSTAAAYFGAIDMAGAYPVALLWGLAPPLMTLRARGRRGKRSQARGGATSAMDQPRDRDRGRARGGSSTAVLFGLVALSLSFVGANLVTDLSALLGRAAATGGARWQ